MLAHFLVMFLCRSAASISSWLTLQPTFKLQLVDEFPRLLLIILHFWRAFHFFTLPSKEHHLLDDERSFLHILTCILNLCFSIIQLVGRQVLLNLSFSCCIVSLLEDRELRIEFFTGL